MLLIRVVVLSLFWRETILVKDMKGKISVRKGELGNFLRSRRQAISPEVVGLQASGKRRTPGLRRDEVAELAGIGVDWYIRLEQGRSTSPSMETVDALAFALRLGEAERAHLSSLVRNVGRERFTRETVPAEIVRLVKSLNVPAYVTGQRWDILVWNNAAAEIFTDFGQLAEADRNLLLYVLTCPEARSIFGASWNSQAQRMVALFRPTFDLWSGDPAFLDVVERLEKGCPEFAGWWQQHNVDMARAGTKLLRQPGRAAQHLHYATFQSNDNRDLKLSIYTPAPTRKTSSV